jgi:hypothetical protein
MQYLKEKVAIQCRNCGDTVSTDIWIPGHTDKCPNCGNELYLEDAGKKFKKPCPFCREKIPVDAIKCPKCQSSLDRLTIVKHAAPFLDCIFDENQSDSAKGAAAKSLIAWVGEDAVMGIMVILRLMHATNLPSGFLETPQQRFMQIKEIGLQDFVMYSPNFRNWIGQYEESKKPEDQEATNMSTKKVMVFISYSWDDEIHKFWVRNLADRLINDGIQTTIDCYDLMPGDDVRVFVEEAVRNATHILCICTPIYVKKANNRDTGVGEETYHLTSRFFQEHREGKNFIPLVRVSIPESNMKLVPDYLANLIYIDFRDDTLFDQKYNDLIRRLYEEPKLKKPPLGQKPIL